MSRLKSLELLTVGAGLFYYTHEVSTIASNLFLGHVPGWCLVYFALSLCLELKFRIKDSDIYRSRDAGLWCSLILPAILNIASPNHQACLQLLVPCSLVMYLVQVQQSVAVYAGMAGLTAYTMLQWMLIQEHKGAVLVCCALYCLLLWRVPAWFPCSFTVGEVAMVTQLITYFLYTTLSCCMDIKGADTANPLDQLTGIVFVGVVLVVVLIRVSTRCRQPLAGLVLAILATGAGFCLPAAVYLVGWPELQETVVGLFWSHTAIALFSWWLLCTLLSLLLVTKYGSQSITRHTLTDISREASGSLYDKADTAAGGDTDSRDSKHIDDDSDAKYKDNDTLDKPSETETRDCAPDKRYKDKNKPEKTKTTYCKTDCDTKPVASRTKKINSSKSETYFEQHDKHLCSPDKAGIQSGKAETQSGVPSEAHLEHQSGSQLYQTGARQTMQKRAPACVEQRVPAGVRKVFHLAMLCVYVPGLMFRPDLLYLASTVAAGVLVVIEASRVARVPVLSSMLNQYLCVFLDQQDRGDLILTPVYLLIGCSLPLWLHTRTGSSPLSLYAGLITIGVGDSAASLLGRRYGAHKWPGSPKSIEGTAAAVIAQISTVMLLYLFGVPGSAPSLSLVFMMCVSACLEAFSTQIDNLVVPAFTYMTLLAHSLHS